MVLEIADIVVQPGTEEEFADAARAGLAVVATSPGFVAARLTRSVETPTRFVLLITWETVEAHTVGFRESADFARWRALVGPFFAGAPHVEHVEDVVTVP